MFYSHVESPLGRLLLAGTGVRLMILGFSSGPRAKRPMADWLRRDAPFQEAKRQLADYFDGRRQGFDLPLEPVGTAFQRRVWQALLLIPYGEVRSYKDIAAATGNPRAALAIGGANASNPLAIVIPCHRVIGSNGRLTGYAGGLPAKRHLLELERSVVGQAVGGEPGQFNTCRSSGTWNPRRIVHT